MANENIDVNKKVKIFLLLLSVISMWFGYFGGAVAMWPVRVCMTITILVGCMK